VRWFVLAGAPSPQAEPFTDVGAGTADARCPVPRQADGP
jgi:hypothetical protein